MLKNLENRREKQNFSEISVKNHDFSENSASIN